jgi:5-hydroxyisourate hydrolase-like protein (transthyretin family)
MVSMREGAPATPLSFGRSLAAIPTLLFCVAPLLAGTVSGRLFGAQRRSLGQPFEISSGAEGDIALPTTTLSGFVTDEATGAPVEGAEVEAETGEETQAFAVKRTATDSTGAYSIPEMDPGSYRVTARKTGYRFKTQPVTIGSEPARLDFALDKGSGIAIRVADGLTGLPLGGVNALVLTSSGNVAFQGSIALDESGAGEIPSLAPGRYAIYVFSAAVAPGGRRARAGPSLHLDDAGRQRRSAKRSAADGQAGGWIRRALSAQRLSARRRGDRRSAGNRLAAPRARPLHATRGFADGRAVLRLHRGRRPDDPARDQVGKYRGSGLTSC